MLLFNIPILNQKYFNFCLKAYALWKMSKLSVFGVFLALLWTCSR